LGFFDEGVFSIDILSKCKSAFSLAGDFDGGGDPWLGGLRSLLMRDKFFDIILWDFYIYFYFFKLYYITSSL